MGLDILYRDRVENWETLCEQPAGTDDAGVPMYRLNPTTQAIGFISFVIGMTDLTRENVDEWWARIYMYQRVNDSKPEWLLTPEDLWAHIGLAVRGRHTRSLTKVQFKTELNRIGREYATDRWREFKARVAAQAAAVPGE